MKSFMHVLALVSSFIFLNGCTSVEVKQYSRETPTLKLEEYFNGTLDAYGIFQDRSGVIKKRFHCVISASWKDGIGTLDEKFDYSDGTKSRRIWTLKKIVENEYIGTAADVVGEAKGTAAGNAFRWKYIMDLEVDGSHYHVKFDDWMFLMNDKVMLNRSKMSKFGIDLGEVTLSFYKR